MKKCDICQEEYAEEYLVKIGERKYVCTDDFFDEILSCLDGNEAASITVKLQDELNKRYNIEDLITRAPVEYNVKWKDGDLLFDYYDKQDFCDKLRDSSYPALEIVDFIGDEATDEFNEVMDYLAVLTFFAANLGVYWEELCSDYSEKYEWFD